MTSSPASAADRQFHRPAAAAGPDHRSVGRAQSPQALAAGDHDLRPVDDRIRGDPLAWPGARHRHHRPDRRPGFVDRGDARLLAPEQGERRRAGGADAGGRNLDRLGGDVLPRDGDLVRGLSRAVARTRGADDGHGPGVPWQRRCSAVASAHRRRTQQARGDHGQHAVHADAGGEVRAALCRRPAGGQDRRRSGSAGWALRRGGAGGLDRCRCHQPVDGAACAGRRGSGRHHRDRHRSARQHRGQGRDGGVDRQRRLSQDHPRRDRTDRRRRRRRHRVRADAEPAAAPQA